MDNCVFVTKENGEKIKIDLIFGFTIEEYNKKYIAYTLNDDGISNTESVFISEITPDNRIFPIPANQAVAVTNAYEEAKKIIEEN